MADETDGSLTGGRTTSAPSFLREDSKVFSLPARGDELRVIRFLDGLESEGASAKDFSSKHWSEALRQLQGDSWRLRRPPHFQANLIRNQVERKVAALTEAKPAIKVVAMKPGLEGAAHVLNQTIKAVWDGQSLDQTLHRMSTFGMALGCGFLYTYWDPQAAFGMGDIRVVDVDPRKVLVDPGVTQAERLGDAAYVVIESFDTLANIRKRFPGRGLLVKPDRQFSSMLEGKARPGSTQGVVSSVMSLFPRVFKPGKIVKEGPIQRATLKEYWIADPTLAEDATPMFPTGRHIIRAGDTILLDEANPYWDGGWPLDMFDWALDLDSPWGAGEVLGLRRIQEAYNRIGDGIIRNALISNNVKVIADMDALDAEKWSELTNEGGVIIRKRPGRELRYEAPPELPQYLFQLLMSLPQVADMLTGNLDPTGGRSGVRAASAIEGLQQSSMTLVRAVARRMEGLLERVGQRLISRVFQFYNEDRMLSALGPSHEWMSFVFERMKLLQDDDGEIRDKLNIAARSREFKFLVVPGSSLASTRVQRTMMLLQLRQALQIAPSIQAILKESDMGDPEQIIAEAMEEMKQLGISPSPPQKKR